MEPSTKDLQLSAAMWALKRIDRKQAGFEHSKDKTQTCDCPQCIARDALAQIQQYEIQNFVKR